VNSGIPKTSIQPTHRFNNSPMH